MITMLVLEIILWIAVIALSIPCVVLFLECVASLFAREPREVSAQSRFVIIMPAHDEQTMIEAGVKHALANLTELGRLLVVADNCTDQTAEIARSAGAEVLERHDPDRRGKGFAIACAVEHLKENPPDVVVILDVDCTMPEGGTQRLASRARQIQRPVQALYEMQLPANSSPRDAISALAFIVKVQVRQRGMLALGAPCQLLGTGMAWPWDAAMAVDLATSAITEDAMLGLEMTMAGYPPILDPSVTVTSQLPEQESAARTQRTRWEQGHIHAMACFPRLFFHAIFRWKPKLLASALDVLIPPLSLLVILLLLGLIAAGLFAAAGESMLPLWVTCGALGLVVISVLLGWMRYGQHLPLTSLLAVPFYLVWKIPIYVRSFFQPEKKWVRTERDDRKG